MSTGFSAVEKVESCWVHIILLGMLECFEVDLKTDQNFYCSILAKMEVSGSTLSAWFLLTSWPHVEDRGIFPRD
jgi:hypothetical protein